MIYMVNKRKNKKNMKKQDIEELAGALITLVFMSVILVCLMCF